MVKINNKLGKEIAIIAALYSVYTLSRNLSDVSERIAFLHAKSVLKVEDFLHIDIEHAIHTFFRDKTYIYIFGNYFYGSLHFIATLFCLFYVFFKNQERYNQVRNTIVCSTLLALVCFISYPLMPPRLLPKSYGFLDTLSKYPTFWSFNSKVFAAISNQFAAMPSVHIIWASWCVYALYPRMNSKLKKMFLFLYPLTTTFVIIVTSNHYILDALGALLVLGIGYLLSRMITSLTTRSAIDKTESVAEINAKLL